ncbi:MAG: JAB domain-containing protein [Halanaerobiales bacterium]
MINIQKYSLRVVKETGGRYDLNKIIKSPKDASDVFIEVLDMNIRPEEVFAIITLDIKNQITGIFEVYVGTLNSSYVHHKEVFKRAILQNSAAIVLGHNHPSGIAKPSKDDIKITKRLMDCGNLLGIDVLDHIIVGNNKTYISMQERGLI